jgi:hypothetical protein
MFMINAGNLLQLLPAGNQKESESTTNHPELVFESDVEGKLYQNMILPAF